MCTFANQDGVTPAILARTRDQVLVGAHMFLEKLNGQDLASALLRMLKGWGNRARRPLPGLVATAL
jgi:hypothetical protein